MRQRVAKPAPVDRPDRRRDPRHVDPAGDNRGTSPSAHWDFGKIPLFAQEPFRPSKWTSSLLRAPETEPGDGAEQSAERAADAASRNEPPQIRSAPATPPDIGTPPWGRGRRMTEEEREWHEPRIGADLKDVRIHEGTVPGRWASLLGARAFSIGHDVVIGSGQYTPTTDSGRHLLNHELSHVVTGGASVLARVALTAPDFDAIADSVHDTLTTAGADEEMIYVALQKLERDPAAIQALTKAYKARHSSDPLTDLASKLKGRGLALAKTLLGSKGGLAVAAKPPGTPADYEAVARAIHTAITAKTPDPEGVYAALLPLDRDPTQVSTLRSAYSKAFSTTLDTDLTAKLTGADQSYALYLLNAPKAATPHAPTTFKAQPGPGIPPASAPPPAAGGTVTAETKVPYETTKGSKGTYGFGVGYTGALSGDSRWLQFIEREIDYDPAGGGQRKALDKEIESGGGANKYRLTTVTTSPNWIVDSYDPSNPFFDETHSNDAWRAAPSVAIYDAPAAREADVKQLLDAGNSNVTSRAHFEIFLIRDFTAIYHVEIEIVWTFSGATKSPPARTIKATGPVNGLPGPLKAALVARYPAFAYIR
jgi:hypothetical protein